MTRKKKELTYPELVEYVNTKLKSQDKKIVSLQDQLHKEELTIVQLWMRVFGGIKKRP